MKLIGVILTYLNEGDGLELKELSQALAVRYQGCMSEDELVDWLDVQSMIGNVEMNEGLITIAENGRRTLKMIKKMEKETMREVRYVNRLSKRVK